MISEDRAVVDVWLLHETRGHGIGTGNRNEFLRGRPRRSAALEQVHGARGGVARKVREVRADRDDFSLDRDGIAELIGRSTVGRRELLLLRPRRSGARKHIGRAGVREGAVVVVCADDDGVVARSHGVAELVPECAVTGQQLCLLRPVRAVTDVHHRRPRLARGRAVVTRADDHRVPADRHGVPELRADTAWCGCDLLPLRPVSGCGVSRPQQGNQRERENGRVAGQLCRTRHGISGRGKSAPTFNASRRDPGPGALRFPRRAVRTDRRGRRASGEHQQPR